MATTQQVVTSTLPTAFEEFYKTGLTAAQSPTGQAVKGLIPQAFGLYGQGTPAQFKADYIDPLTKAGLYGAGRVAGLSQTQTDLGKQITQMGTPSQFGTGTTALQRGSEGLAGLLNQQALSVAAPNLQQFQMGPADVVYGQQYQAPSMVTAQTGYQPQLSAFQIGQQERFGAQQAEEYMSPYMQNVTDVAKRRAIEDAQKTQLGANLGAARQGTYGGARQLLAQTERERGLREQLGDIQTRGLESAFGQAQQQFERDRAAQLQTQQANLQAALGVQQLGTQTGLQTALANLSAEQQANVQNQAAQLQTQGLNAQQALQAALANQQAGLTVGQQNLQAALGIQQLGAGQSLEAQRANQAAGLQAAQQQQQAALGLGQIGSQLGQLGVAQQAADIDRLKTLGAYGDLERALSQQQIDARYADLMRGIEFPESQLDKLSGFIRGIPMTGSVTQTTTPPPSFASQLSGMGIAGLGLYNAMTGGR
jgi:hypothetical protein